jgi:hypothetical protein
LFFFRAKFFQVRILRRRQKRTPIKLFVRIVKKHSYLKSVHNTVLQKVWNQILG